MSLINNSSGWSGIYRGIIVKDDPEIRIYIPALHNNTFGCNSDELLAAIDDNRKSFPLPVWCAPNIASVNFEDKDAVWVIFENGDIKRPVIVGFLGRSIKEAASGGIGGAGGAIGGNGCLTGCDTYNLDDSTIEWIATCVTGEGGGDDIERCREYASHAANLHEVNYGRSGRDSEAIRQSVKKASSGGWYADASWGRGCSDSAKQAVKEVFVEGKRYLPRYVTEFDTFPMDIKNAKSKEEYKKGDAISNVYGSNYFFYKFFKSGDLSGYFQNHYDKYKDDDSKMTGGGGTTVVGGKIDASNWIYPLSAKHTLDPTTGGREFGAGRSNGSRTHAGVDLIQVPGTKVIASTNGVVDSICYNFYGGTDAIAVRNTDGSWINYTECKPDVKVGDNISQGQVIGHLVANNVGGSCMLHTEVYAGDSSGSLLSTNGDFKYVPQKPYKRRCDLCDPMFVMNLPMK